MAVEVIWTRDATETFTSNISYLEQEWSEKEVKNFVQQANQVIDRIAKYPDSYPTGAKSKNYRRARLNKYIVLFYKYFKSTNKLVLITFWNTKQDISKAKFR
jgi:plasmid stabilization system protein ParE